MDDQVQLPRAKVRDRARVGVAAVATLNPSAADEPRGVEFNRVGGQLADEAVLTGVDEALGIAIVRDRLGSVAWHSPRASRLALPWGSVETWWRDIAPMADEQGRADVRDATEKRHVFDVVHGVDGLRYVRDVTDDVVDAEEAIRARNDLASARDAALAASRSKSSFLANMSHELRTPLNAILGYGEMLLEEAQATGNEASEADVQRVLGAGRHLLQLITDVLDLARIEAGRVSVQLGDVDVRLAVAEVVAEFAVDAAARGNRVEIAMAPGPMSVRTDGLKLKYVLRALVSNAVRFTEHGAVQIAVERQGDVLLVVVTDSGIGLDEEHRDRLFTDPYPSEKSSARRQGGRGFGLQLSRRNLEMLGGRLGVESEKGAGSKFWFELPVRSAFVESVLPAQVVELAATDGRPVLVIDDDPNVGELIARYLGREGMSVVVARDGAQGLELARRVKPALITLDVIMPGATGWSVLQQLKADPELAEIPVIMVTMLDEGGEGLALGAADYLTKPLSREGLVTAIRRHLKSPGQVLVVEDDPSTRLLAERALAREGFPVHSEVDGRAAITWLEHNVPALILLDLLMPEVDGFGVLAWLSGSEAHRDVPVLVVTGLDASDIDTSRLVGNVRSIVRKGGRSGDGVFGDIAALARGLAGR